MKKIIILNSCNWKKDFIFERLFSLWYYVILADLEISNNIKKFIHEIIKIDTKNIEDSYKTIIDYYKKNDIDWILTFWEDDVLLLSKIIEKINKNWIPFSIAKNIRNKLNFRKIKIPFVCKI